MQNEPPLARRSPIRSRRHACRYGAGPRRRAQPGAQRSRAYAVAARAASAVCFARRARVARRRYGRGAWRACFTRSCATSLSHAIRIGRCASNRHCSPTYRCRARCARCARSALGNRANKATRLYDTAANVASPHAARGDGHLRRHDPLYKAASRAVDRSGARLGIAPARCVYVGDARRDVRSRQCGGNANAVARWGYIEPDEAPDSWPGDGILEEPSALLDWLRSADSR
jgi:hypothetical protein